MLAMNFENEFSLAWEKKDKLICCYIPFHLGSSYLLSHSFSCCIREKNMHFTPFFKYEIFPATTKSREDISTLAN